MKKGQRKTSERIFFSGVHVQMTFSLDANLEKRHNQKTNQFESISTISDVLIQWKLTNFTQGLVPTS